MGIQTVEGKDVSNENDADVIPSEESIKQTEKNGGAVNIVEQSDQSDEKSSDVIPVTFEGKPVKDEEPNSDITVAEKNENHIENDDAASGLASEVLEDPSESIIETSEISMKESQNEVLVLNSAFGGRQIEIILKKDQIEALNVAGDIKLYVKDFEAQSSEEISPEERERHNSDSAFEHSDHEGQDEESSPGKDESTAIQTKALQDEKDKIYEEFAKQQKLINFEDIHRKKEDKTLPPSDEKKDPMAPPINLCLNGFNVKFDVYGKQEKPKHANLIWERV